MPASVSKAGASGGRDGERRLPLARRLLGFGVFGVVLLIFVVGAGLRGLQSLEATNRAVQEISLAQRFQQDGDMQHDALRADVFDAILIGQGLPGDTSTQVLLDTNRHATLFRSDLLRISALDLPEPARTTVARARLATQDYIAQAEALAELATSKPDAAVAERAAFEQLFHQVEASQEHLTRVLSNLESARLAAARKDATFQRDTLIATSGAALAGLVTLTLFLTRLGRRLSFVVSELEQTSARQQFSVDLTRALEMTQSERDAIAVLMDAVSAQLPGAPHELLLTDSSKAHLHRVTHTADVAPGCGVQAANDCPAVRRGSTLTFVSSGDLGACPKLRERHPLSAVCAPVTFLGDAIGVLHATAPDGQPPSEEQVQRMSAMADQVGTRIGTLRVLATSQLQASTDGLTGLLNRRTIEDKTRALLQAERPFAFAMIDLDRFKQLNDRHGHEAGDRALRLFSQTLRARTRLGDLFARYGGEEFVLVMPDVTAQQALDLLERHRLALAEAVGNANTPAFTASFGVADSSAGDDFDTVARAADVALMTAKTQGRDRVVLAQPRAAEGSTRAWIGGENATVLKGRKDIPTATAPR